MQVSEVFRVGGMTSAGEEAIIPPAWHDPRPSLGLPPALPCHPSKEGGSGGSVEGSLPWQWSGRAMAVAVQGSMEGEALVDGDARLQLLEPV